MAAKKKTATKKASAPLKEFKTLNAFYVALKGGKLPKTLRLEIDYDTVRFHAKTGATKQDLEDGADFEKTILEADTDIFIKDAIKRQGKVRITTD